MSDILLNSDGSLILSNWSYTLYSYSRTVERRLFYKHNDNFSDSLGIEIVKTDLYYYVSFYSFLKRYSYLFRIMYYKELRDIKIPMFIIQNMVDDFIYKIIKLQAFI